MMKLLILIFSLFLKINESITDYSNPSIQIEDITVIDSFNIPNIQVQVTKNNIDQLDPRIILAAVCEHEGRGQLSITERALMIETIINRVETNYSNNGKSLIAQLTAKRQFPLFDNKFQYNGSKKSCIEDYYIANWILAGNRMSTQTVLYWACEGDAHFDYCKRNQIKGFVTKQIFAI